MNEKIERQERVLHRVLDWIKAADSRVPPMAALNTAMLGVVAGLGARGVQWDFFSVISFAATVALLLSGLLALGIATFPRTSGPAHSLIFFGGIKSIELATYQSAMSKLTDEDYLSDLTSQTHRNAEIAGLKFRYVRLAMIFWFVGIVPWLFTLYFVLRSGL